MSGAMLPCPFCGNEFSPVAVDEANAFDPGDHRWSVVCSTQYHDGCGGSVGYLDTEAEAIEAWNTRAALTPPPLPPLVRFRHGDPRTGQLPRKPEATQARDWMEDYAHDADNEYQNRCLTCGELFNGHKRRLTCKTCVKPEAAPSADMEWLLAFLSKNLPSESLDRAHRVLLAKPEPAQAEAVAEFIGRGNVTGEPFFRVKSGLAPGTKLYTTPPNTIPVQALRQAIHAMKRCREESGNKEWDAHIAAITTLIEEAGK